MGWKPLKNIHDLYILHGKKTIGYGKLYEMYLSETTQKQTENGENVVVVVLNIPQVPFPNFVSFRGVG